ncbi:hypothetical protein [Mucilaginibacter sp.]
MNERQRISIKVFYTAGKQAGSAYDHRFGKAISWDIPLMDGYEFFWLENAAENTGYHHFNGIGNPTAIKEINSWVPDAVLVFGWACKSHLKIIRYYINRIPVLSCPDIACYLDIPEPLTTLFRTSKQLIPSTLTISTS